MIFVDFLLSLLSPLCSSEFRMNGQLQVYASVTVLPLTVGCWLWSWFLKFLFGILNRNSESEFLIGILNQNSLEKWHGIIEKFDREYVNFTRPVSC